MEYQVYWTHWRPKIWNISNLEGKVDTSDVATVLELGYAPSETDHLQFYNLKLKFSSIPSTFASHTHNNSIICTIIHT